MISLPVLDSAQSVLLLSLADHIAQRRITQCEVATATGVHQSQISRILGGRVRRASKNVLKLCKYAEFLPLLPRTATEPETDVLLSELKLLLGRSQAEDAALRQVVTSLSGWRRTWGNSQE